MNKDFFFFGHFNELKVGDVFKFPQNLYNDIPSKFYTVYQKDENTTKINATYGKLLNRLELENDTPIEVMIFQNRKINLKNKTIKP